MIKVLLIFCIVHVHLFALDTIKIKAKQKNNIVRVKTLIPYKSITYSQAYKSTGDKSNAHFITQITAEVNKKIVFHMLSGPALSASPILKFTYLYPETGDMIKVTAKDNKGHILQHSRKIKKSIHAKNSLISQRSRNATNYKSTKPKAWTENTVEGAIVELYGKTDFIDSGIKLTAPKCQYGHQVPIYITSDLALRSIAVFQSSTSYPTVAMITVYENQPINYYLRVNIISNGPEDTQMITVIGEDKEGKLYRTQQQVNTITYSHYHCNEDSEVEYDL